MFRSSGASESVDLFLLILVSLRSPFLPFGKAILDQFGFLRLRPLAVP